MTVTTPVTGDVEYVGNDDLLAAHLPDGFLFETCGNEILLSGPGTPYGRFAKLTPYQAGELGRYLLRMSLFATPAYETDSGDDIDDGNYSVAEAAALLESRGWKP